MLLCTEWQNVWEQRKLEELTIKIGSGKTPKGGNTTYLSSGIPLLRSQNIYNGIVNWDDVVYISGVTNEGMLNSQVLQNDILLNITGASIGRSAVYEEKKVANVNQHVCIIRLKCGINSFFVHSYLVSEMGQKQIELNQAGGGREGLNFKQISNFEFLYPSIAEQNKIANLLENLTESIALHQRKLEHLKILKQAYLQQMFPSDTENVPKLRFANYTDQWEMRTLSDVATINPKSVIPDEFEYVDLESVVGTNLITFRTERKEHAPSRAQRLAENGDVFYQTVRPYQKNNYLFDLPYDNFVFSTGYTQLRPFGDEYFLLTRLQEDNFVSKVLDRCTGTSYPAINSTALAEIEVSYPKSVEEESEIGELFKSLDCAITFLEMKLDTVSQLKSAYLQKMFI